MPRKRGYGDDARLRDMLVYAREIVGTAGTVTFEHYLGDQNLRLATERRLEIIGEAARKVSPTFRAQHPEIPWRKIIAMRHVLAHEYGEIKDEVIFRVARMHIHDLIGALEPLVPPPPGDDP